MDKVTQQNAAMVEQATAAAQALSHETDELAQLMQRFRTKTPNELVPARTTNNPLIRPAAIAPRRSRPPRRRRARQSCARRRGLPPASAPQQAQRSPCSLRPRKKVGKNSDETQKWSEATLMLTACWTFERPSPCRRPPGHAR